MSSARHTIVELRGLARERPLKAKLRAQIEGLVQKESAAGKPYWEVQLRDESDCVTLRAWNDTPAFLACGLMECGDCVEVDGEFAHNGSFGLEARKWALGKLDEDAAEELFAGSEALRRELAIEFEFIRDTVDALADPRLRRLGQLFLQEYGDRFRRAAAARNFPHARRGGLCQHTAQMMRSALAVAQTYPSLNRDLLLAGVLFHDCGKLWETCPPERGFEIGRELLGELLGHITIGIEVLNRLWQKLEAERHDWEKLDPPSEHVRMHLLHLVASHHGELQFGSPVEPRTPEAVALHHLDNLDAKLEMFAGGYAKTPQIAPGIFDRIRPLPGNPVAPLAHFEAPAH